MNEYRIVLDLTATIEAKNKEEALKKLSTDILDNFMITNIITVERIKK